MMHRNKVVAVALSLLLASSALSSVAMAQNADTTNREEMKRLMNEADRLHDKAKKLLARAEEQGNQEAIVELEIVVKLTVEAKILVEAGDLERAKALLGEAREHLAKAERMLANTVKKIKKEVEGDIDAILRVAEHLHNTAKRLMVIAEEQANVEAKTELEVVIKLVAEVKVAVESEDLETAKKILEEARDHLAKAERLLKHAVKKVKEVKDEVEEDAKVLLHMVEKLHDTAKRVIAIAEEKGNVEAKVEAEICVKLTLEAKVLIEEGNYDDAKAKLREAADHLSKAMRMLQLTETTEPERPKRPERPFVFERPTVVAHDTFGFEFEINGSGYAVLKNQNTVGILYETEISMHGTVMEERERGIHFVVDDVVITTQPYGPSIMVDGRMITLTSVDEWDGKARHRLLFMTGGQMEDDEGNTYKVLLRGRLIDASEQGLVYKIDGRVYPTDSTDNGIHRLFASLHYLAIAQAVA